VVPTNTITLDATTGIPSTVTADVTKCFASYSNLDGVLDIKVTAC